MWNYSATSGNDKNGMPIHSSVYKNLRVNGPTDILQYKDFFFPKDTPALCGHEDVRKYIEQFANHFKLKKFIKFNTIVTKIKPIQIRGNKNIWEVHVKDVNEANAESEVEIFDTVMVASGCFSSPYVPDIPGLNEFAGKQMHSFDYRVPEEFEGMRVAVLGGIISGQDIAVDVSRAAREVIFSHNLDPFAWDLPKNIRQIARIERLGCNRAIMENGTEYQVDALILCTGYRKHMPFLSPECRVSLEEGRIYPLYKHVIHTGFPSLVFIGFNEIDTVFTNCEVHVKFAMAAWEGKYKLPSQDDMDADTKRDFEIRQSLGIPTRQAHILAFEIRPYHDELARLGGFEPLSRHHYDIWELMLEIFLCGLTFKDYDFERDDTGKIDLKKFQEFFIREQQKATCGMEEIRRRLKKVQLMRPQ